jgi:hypothetical protein
VSDCEAVTVSAILWTSAKRCSFVLNSRGWKCKKPPTHMMETVAKPTRGGAYCEEHIEALKATCP